MTIILLLWRSDIYYWSCIILSYQSRLIILEIFICVDFRLLVRRTFNNRGKHSSVGLLPELSNINTPITHYQW